jgi:hypothetical protein
VGFKKERDNTQDRSSQIMHKHCLKKTLHNKILPTYKPYIIKSQALDATHKLAIDTIIPIMVELSQITQ